MSTTQCRFFRAWRKTKTLENYHVGMSQPVPQTIPQTEPHATPQNPPQSAPEKALRKALIVGATGLAGSELLNLLLADARYASVQCMGRRAPQVKHGKLVAHLLDLANTAQLAKKLAELPAVTQTHALSATASKARWNALRCAATRPANFTWGWVGIFSAAGHCPHPRPPAGKAPAGFFAARFFRSGPGLRNSGTAPARH